MLSPKLGCITEVSVADDLLADAVTVTRNTDETALLKCATTGPQVSVP